MLLKIKKNFILLFFCSISLGGYAFVDRYSAEYDISGFYVGTNVDDNTKALTTDGLKEISIVFTPTTLNQGKYVVKVTRKAANLYKVDGKNVFIETRYCYEYSTGDEVILTVDSQYGYSKGKLKF